MKKITFLLLLFFLGVSSVWAAAYQNLYLVGDGTTVGWNNGGALQMTTTTTDGIFTWTRVLNKNGASSRFKFLVDGKNWSPSLTCQTVTAGHKVITSGVAEDLYVFTGAGADNAFQVPETAEYTVVVDLNTMKMTCTKTAVIDTSVPDLTQLYIVGNATSVGWTPGSALTMVKVQDGVFYWGGNLTGDGEFKFLNTKGSWDRTINPLDANTDFVLGTEYSLNYRQEESSPNDYKFKAIATGLYAINVNLNTMKMIINIAAPDLSQLYLVGSATSAGWDNANPIEMTSQENGIFTWSGDLTANGEFKFLNERGIWSKTINPDAGNTTFSVGTEYSLNYRPMEASPNDYKFMVPSAGRYTITANLNTMKITIQNSTDIGTGISNNINLSRKIHISGKTVSILADNKDKIQSVGIFNITGKCVHYVSNINSTVILGDNLAQGVYIVKMNYNDLEYVQKLIIK